jgi:predicted RNA-binding Zn-ribbon protein involved in translation (DUF1610 family)
MAKPTSTKELSESSNCPNCGEPRLVPIVYGFPGDSLMRLAQQGVVQLGGCIVGGDDPQFHCPACDHDVWVDGRTQVQDG